MDVTSSLLLLARGDSTIYTVIMISIVPMFGKIIEFLFEYLRTEIYLPLRRQKGPKEWASVSLMNIESMIVGAGTQLVGKATEKYKAVRNYIIDNKMANAVREVDNSFFDEKYDLEICYNIPLKDDMYFDVTRVHGGEKQKNSTHITLKSRVRTLSEIEDFISELVKKENEASILKTKNLIYHCVYKGIQQGRLMFTNSIISDLNSEETTSPETFAHIFNEHKEKLIADIDRLDDVIYHNKRGLRRKKGYLFYGEPGCGKTYSVMAMANHAKRHIIEVPMSRVKTNAELEEILELKYADFLSFKKSEVIFLFDEIDCDSSLIRESEPLELQAVPTTPPALRQFTTEDEFEISPEFRKLNATPKPLKKEPSQSEESPEPDKLSLGTVLSRLDGIGNYNGSLFIATTNHIEKLDKALYRHGRLTPIHFGYSRREDIKNMIESDFGTELTEEQISNLPDRENKFTPSTVKSHIQDYENNLEGLLEFLAKSV